MGRRISTKSVYGKKKYYALGLPMTFYWALPKLGYLDEAPDGLRWERMKNCEIRVYEYEDGHHTFVKSYSLGKK